MSTKMTVDKTYVVDADLSFGRGFHEGAVAELSRQVEALIFANHPLVLQVAFVTHQHHRDVIRVLE